ncbi:Exportin-1 [Venturia nashicola]|uniref:Exportin-1 n=1 Tax=Venturia nashicola TaxID=86259 RepID=A0A4Z1PNT1_9PEZI|nr:Exportin-1 [Venturia nashicola]
MCYTATGVTTRVPRDEQRKKYIPIHIQVLTLIYSFCAPRTPLTPQVHSLDDFFKETMPIYRTTETDTVEKSMAVEDKTNHKPDTRNGRKENTPISYVSENSFGHQCHGDLSSRRRREHRSPIANFEHESASRHALDLGAHYIAWESGSQIIPGFTSYTQYPQTFFRRPPVSSWYKIVPGPRVNSGFTLRLKDEAADEEAVAMLYL